MQYSRPFDLRTSTVLNDDLYFIDVWWQKKIKMVKSLN